MKSRGRGTRYIVHWKSKVHLWDEEEISYVEKVNGARKRKTHRARRREPEKILKRWGD